MYCFTTQYNCISNELKNNVAIFSPIGNKDDIVKNKVALWDTGATSTVINEELAKELKLIPLGRIPVKTPSGGHESNIYYINIVLPNDVKIEKIKVCSGFSSQWDVLIGMDIINLGDFAVSNYSGKTTFSFRMPSLKEIIFTK